MKPTELLAILERQRLAAIAHREAVAAIAYKITQSPAFGGISGQMLENYELTRLELLDIEQELRQANR